MSSPTYERRFDSRSRQVISEVDSEDGVSQKNADLKGDARATVQRKVEADHVHQH